MSDFEIPAGLTDILQDFTVEVLRAKPSDLIQFACDYFNRINEARSSKAVFEKKGVSFGGGEESGDEPMQTDDSDEEPMEPPRNRFQRRQSVSAERYDPEADDDDDEVKVVHPKSDDQRQRLNEAVRNILLFKSLDTEQMTEVIDAMFEKKATPNEKVIIQGDDGDNFYVIDSGTYDIYVVVDGKDKCVGSYDNTGSFGELALMYNMPRAATIVATSEGSLWAMDRLTFRRIVLKNAYTKRKMYETLLESVPMLQQLDPYERMNVADALMSRKYEDGQQIIKQGDSADVMYFVEDGEVRITAKKSMWQGRESDDDPEVEVSRCNKGAYFGELALLTHKPRAASVYAVGVTKCAVLDVNAFERLLGNCKDIMQRNEDYYEAELATVFGSKTNISDLR